MRVARLHAAGEIQLHDEPAPAPGPGEALIRIQAVGVCGSDLHWFAEAGIGDAQLRRPLVLGHEFAGVTEAGERVAVDPAVFCGACEMCRRGHTNLCERLVFAGHASQDGALQEQLCWPTQCLHRLPDSLSAGEGALLEPLGVALHAADLAKLRPGMTVAVLGCGPLGLLIVQVARLAGAAKVFATDRLAHRVEAARRFGAELAVLAGDAHQVDEEIRDASAGRGVDVAFEVAGDQAAVDSACAAAASGGKVILAGIPSDDHTSFSASTARRKGLTIKLVRRMKDSYARAIDLVSRRKIDLNSLITHRFPLEQTAEAFRVAARREGLKVLVEL